jgi:hypothetical protein
MRAGSARKRTGERPKGTGDAPHREGRGHDGLRSTTERSGLWGERFDPAPQGSLTISPDIGFTGLCFLVRPRLR